MISFITPTHNPKHLRETYESLLKQTRKDWEWIVVYNNGLKLEDIEIVLDLNYDDEPRLKAFKLPLELDGKGIGAIKKWSFMQGSGDYLAELDHDDLLTPNAAEEIEKAFKETGADFVYSNACDFSPNGEGHWFPNWQQNGWRYRNVKLSGKEFNECISFEPSAASMSLIYYAPNHIRVWEKEFYKRIGGHNPSYMLADDHELCIRTYLLGRMHHISKPLYLYRMGENNTFAKNIDEIRRLTNQLYVQYLDKLIVREAQLKGEMIYDLGGAFNCPEGWVPVDKCIGVRGVEADLSGRWPFEDSSVLSFRAYDIFEHLPDKQHTMRELHRCLKPGGWALIQIPSTDGRGAFQDPTHVSYWNENSFWYYTDPEKAKYIRNEKEHFISSRLFTFFPDEWHEKNNIPYVKAELRAIKGDMIGHPGFSEFRK